MLDLSRAGGQSSRHYHGGATMKAIVRIPNISWRDGRPRFNPGPKLRKLGLKGEDLRHADGRWFELREAEDWAKALQPIIAERRAKKAAGGRLKPLASGRKAAYTIEDMFEDLFRSKKFQMKAAATQADYRNKAKAFALHKPELYGVPAAEMTKPAVLGLHEELWEAKGLSMANGMIAVMRLAYSDAIARGCGGIAHNPCEKLRLKSPPPRLRVGSPVEMMALIASADEMEITIGDAIVIGLFTGQRQGDVLALAEEGIENGRVNFRQRKTGARVSIKAIAMLVNRLEAIAARRREAATVRLAQTIVVDPRSGRQWNKYSFGHRFAEIRAEAAKACPSLADFHFADLRDTAITWLHRSGVDVPGIRSVTGHSDQTIHTILKHYLAIDEDTNDRAMATLESWLAEKGVRL